MPSALPDGDPVPPDGSLPADALVGLAERPFGLYVHVPFCRVRCGYCDFNTYTVAELGGPGATLDTYAEAVLRELDLAVQVFRGTPPVVDTVFVGGGTPTMLPASDLARLLSGARERFGLSPGAEVTTEANPDTVTPQVADELAAAGFTRVSLGMQSAVPHVLATLNRTHDPANVASAVQAVRAAGMQVSLDLIYGTPGESLADWQSTLGAAIALEPDHVSAYALVVEEGTKLAAQVRRGLVPMPDDDDEADKYQMAEEALSAAGFDWYEISNWARSASARCRHNLGYWQGGNWWAAGPGAHSHVGGVRWWNVKHPSGYAARLANGASPALAREVLTPLQRHQERVLLEVRLAEGLAIAELSAPGRRAVGALVLDGLLEAEPVLRGRAVLTVRGRLLADTVVHRLLSDGRR